MKNIRNRIRLLLGILALGISGLAQAQDDLTPPQVSRHALSPFISKEGVANTGTRISLYFTEPLDEESAKDV